MNAIQENNTAKGTAGKNNNRSLTRRVADKFMTGAGIFTFLRSSVASQIASWIDMGVCFIFYAWVFMPLGKDPLRSFLATAIGLVVGGVVNCCINYKFTFRAEHCSVKAVAVKYFLIWGGSFLLNLVGTTALDHLLQHAGWLESRRHIRICTSRSLAHRITCMELSATEKFRICIHPFRSFCDKIHRLYHTT